MDTHLHGWVYVGVHGYRRIPFNLRSMSEATYEHVYSPRRLEVASEELA
ncbi:Uncharacterised protein [Mycobacteroides abscessus subsp. massiliense]|nr:Uncharacterised protein [Mycobacteroides abscessus subsp. massiliense]